MCSRPNTHTTCVVTVEKFNPLIETLLISRNQTVKKLTMGYITNSSYCTATVSVNYQNRFSLGIVTHLKQ